MKGQRWYHLWDAMYAGVGSTGHWNFLKIRNRRWDCRPLKFFKNQKPSLGMPAIENLFKSRRYQRRPLPPVSKRTNLVIFLKAALEFGFLFFKELLPYKTHIFWFFSPKIHSFQYHIFPFSLFKNFPLPTRA